MKRWYLSASERPTQGTTRRVVQTPREGPVQNDVVEDGPPTLLSYAVIILFIGCFNPKLLYWNETFLFVGAVKYRVNIQAIPAYKNTFCDSIP